MPRPFVTALIDAYNHEAFIEKAITSEGQLHLLSRLSDRESEGSPMVARGS